MRHRTLTYRERAQVAEMTARRLIRLAFLGGAAIGGLFGLGVGLLW